MSSIPRASNLSAIKRLSQASNVSLEKPQNILKAQPKSVIFTIKGVVSINDVGSNLALERDCHFPPGQTLISHLEEAINNP